MKLERALEVASRARLHPPRAADPSIPAKVGQNGRSRDHLGRYVVGHTAPGPGKPVGGRGRLAAALVDDLLATWPRSGRAAIRKPARERLMAYLKLMAHIAKHLRKSGD